MEYELDEDGLYSHGGMSLKDFDDANVPVDIWFEELKQKNNIEFWDLGFRWQLTCGNYMPRDGDVAPCVVEVYAKEKESLQKAIAKYILPLYQVAIDKLNKMVNEGEGKLYYWSKDE